MEWLLLVLLVATWGGVLWVYRRMADDLDGLRRQRREQGNGEAAIAVLTEQLQQAAEELGEALDRRTERLRQLLAQADRQIEAYAPPAAAAAGPAPAEVARPALAAPAAVVPGASERDAARTVEAEPAAAVEHGRGAGGGEPGGGMTGARLAGHGAGHGGGYEDVLRLAEQGLDAEEIARRTHRGREEVRLLLQRTRGAAVGGTAR